MEHEVIVIGAGAAGMMTALTLAERGVDAALLEANDAPGKKLLATGNGKCNFTNTLQNAECYRGEHPEAAMELLEKYDVACVLRFFERLGILPKQRDGYWYPNSEQAASVRDAFVFRLSELSVPVYDNTHAERIEKKDGRFCITAMRRERLPVRDNRGRRGKRPEKPFFSQSYEALFRAEYVVLATGGTAGNISGADGSGYAFAKGFGHRIVPPVPALVQLRTQKAAWRALSGVRTQAQATLRIQETDGREQAACIRQKDGGEQAAVGGGKARPAQRDEGAAAREYREFGEILFTDYGISGIPTMQLSRFAARELAKGDLCGKIELLLDFFPDTSENDLQRMLYERFETFGERAALHALNGLLPSKLCAALLTEAELSTDRALPVRDMGVQGVRAVHRLAACMKRYCAPICGTNDFANAQVTAGGVDLGELDGGTMESKLTEKLYVVGELADIDGTCGGYNLQWAWMSALAAADGICRRKNR